MIKKNLHDLISVQGVEAIALYGIDNTLIDSWGDTNFNREIFDQVALHYLQVFSVLDLKLQNYNEIVITHEKGQFYARILPDLLIVVSLKSMKEVALTRLVINVHLTELLTSKAFQKVKKKLSLSSQNLLDKKYLDDSERDYLKKMEI
jgi:hypothetical protein